jgi:hypothetical protein
MELDGRRRKAVLASTLAGSLAAVVQPVVMQDWQTTDLAVTRLLHGGLTNVYADPGFLEGPLSLLIGLALHPLGSSAALVWAVLAGAMLGPLLLLSRQDSWVLTLLCVAPWASFAAAGHPDDLGAVALMLLAAYRAPGWCLAAAVAFKPWAVAGMGALRSRRDLLIFAGFAVVLWLPVLLSHPAMSGQWIVVQTASPMALVFGAGRLPGWVRPAQLLAMAGSGWFAARRVSVPASMTVALAVRIATEPGGFDYYFGPLVLMAAVSGSRRTTVLAVGAWLVKFAPDPAWWRLALLVAVAVSALRLANDVGTDRVVLRGAAHRGRDRVLHPRTAAVVVLVRPARVVVDQVRARVHAAD